MSSGRKKFLAKALRRNSVDLSSGIKSAYEHIYTGKNMSEHHTQGRQGQGARHHRRYRSNRNYRHRMPRPEDGGANKKPSLLKRILSFFGFGKKNAQKPERKKERSAKPASQAPQRVRVAQAKNGSKNGGAPAKMRRRATSVLPTEQARLYVGNLSFEAGEDDLRDLFKGFGHVRSVEIIYNTRTYRSKGYAFVEMELLADAQRAAEVLHGHPYMGRELMVSAASEKADRGETTAPACAEAGEAEAPAPAPKRAPMSDDDELQADFGEEVVVQLGQDLPPVEPAPAPAAEPAPAEAPAEEAPAEEEQKA